MLKGLLVSAKQEINHNHTLTGGEFGGFKVAILSLKKTRKDAAYDRENIFEKRILTSTFWRIIPEANKGGQWTDMDENRPVTDECIAWGDILRVFRISW